MGKIYSIILHILLILAILLNLNWLKSPVLGVIFSLPYLLVFGYLLGKLVFSSFEKSWQFLMGSFSLLSVYSLLGAIVYFIYRLDQVVVSILIIIISGIILYFARYKIYDLRFKFPNFNLRPACRSFSEGRTSDFGLPAVASAKAGLRTCILTVSYVILFAVAIITLLSCQTTDVIRSTWQVIPRTFFLIYFLATLNLFLIIKNSKLHTSAFGLRPSILISLHFFLTTTLALIIYRLGYGFDPFIHQATESAIFNQGFILPKPLYYLGQYSLVVILSHFFQISTDWIDKLLLPILLSVFLPYTIYTSLTKTFNWTKNQALTLSLIFLILPFELFIVTNPQALANLLAIIILFLSFLYLKDKPGLGLAAAKTSQDGQIPFWFLGFLTLVTIAIHALAGIPVAIYLILVWLIGHKSKLTQILLPIFAIFATLSLPFALYLNSLISTYKIQFNWQSFNLISWPTIFHKQFNYFLDLAYLYKNSIHWLILILSLITLCVLVRRKLTSAFVPGLITFLILVANAIFLNFITVSSIINYEQGEFSQRIFQLAFYFLLPIVIYGLYLILEKIELKPFIYKLSIISMLSLLLSLSLYQSYPRFDDYENSKFINVSASDYTAINFIEQNSDGQPYIVIANQTTSVAALKTFGFTRYYNGHYFYPIPTGGELYKSYEAMIYDQASIGNMDKARDLTRVKTAYFVIPFYWSHFDTISKQAEASADAVYNLGDKVMVFKYFR